MRTVLAIFIDAKRTVAVDPLFGFAKRRTLTTTPASSPSAW